MIKKNIFLLYISCFFVFQLNAQTYLKVSNGNLKVTGDVDMVLQNTKWVNNGTVTASDGTIILTGNTSQSNSDIGGSGSTSFYNLTINKSLNDAQLSQDASVANTLTLQSGSLDIKNSNLDLGSGGSFVLVGNEYVITSGTGTMNRVIANGESKVFPVGNDSYTPMTIQNDGTGDSYSVRTTSEVLSGGNSGNPFTTSVVDRTWFIDETVIGGSNLTLTATWNGSDELPGFNRSDCSIAHYDNGWDTPTGALASGSDPYSIGRSGITTLSPFAVFTENALPVELLYFNAYLQGEQTHLAWETTLEINSSHFDIEHSVDAIRYEKIGEEEAVGFSGSNQQYGFLHENPVDGLNYYRLKINDLDGSYVYSVVQIVELNLLNLQGFINLKVYPNPASEILNVQFSKIPENGSIELFDELGRSVLFQQITGTKNQMLLIDQLNPGIYFIKVVFDDKQFEEKILIL